jgi:uncharacterized protein YicC (UPF0701 family)
MVDPLGPLADWISRAQAQLDAQSTAIDDLRGQLSEARQEAADLDRRLTKILALLDDKLAGGQSEEGMQHHAYAQQYVSLVEQQILALAVAVFRAFPDAPPSEKAEFVAFTCKQLFGAAEVAESDFIDALLPDLPEEVFRLARQICVLARDLRGKAAQGRRQRWSFDFAPGAPINPGTQLPWPGSAPNGVVTFVVAPAYVVEAGTLLARQWVFTAPGSRADRDAPGRR